MVRDGSPPGDRPPAPAGLLWLLPAVLMAVCTAAAVTLVDPGARAAVAVCGGLGAVAVAFSSAQASRHRRAFAEIHVRHAEQLDSLKHLLHEQERELGRVTTQVLPRALGRVQRGGTVDAALRDVTIEGDVSAEYDKLLRRMLQKTAEAVKLEEDLRESAQRAFVNVARRVQAIVHQQASEMREMEHRHGTNPEVFEDLLRLDHGNALIGRLADSIAVLGGARPGRQWQKDISLLGVLRGAMSRIQDYRRVDMHPAPELAVVSTAVEPLIHLLSELLDNATRYSPPKARVTLSAKEIQTGLAIEIEDGGVGLTEEARRRAERLLEASVPGMDISDLGEAPRLGLAVVGRLARTNGFQVSLRTSAYSGVRVIVVVPGAYITASPISELSLAVARFGALTRPRPMLVPNEDVPHDEEPEETFEINADGLPQRRRRTMRGAPAGRPRAVAPPRAPRATPTPPPAAPAEAPAKSVEPGVWLAAFHNAVSGGNSASESGRGTDKSTDDGE